MTQRQNNFHQRVDKFGRGFGFFFDFLDGNGLLKNSDNARHFKINISDAKEYVAVNRHGQNFSGGEVVVIIADFARHLEQVSYRQRGVEVVAHCVVKIRKQTFRLFDETARTTDRYRKIFFAGVLDEFARMNFPRQFVKLPISLREFAEKFLRLNDAFLIELQRVAIMRLQQK